MADLLPACTGLTKTWKQVVDNDLKRLHLHAFDALDSNKNLSYRKQIVCQQHTHSNNSTFSDGRVSHLRGGRCDIGGARSIDLKMGYFFMRKGGIVFL